jgi:hypothetical protein
MKIRYLVQVILITLAIHSIGYANSKTLWGKSEYGMTPAQILKVFPDAVRSPNYDGVATEGKVIIPSLAINSHEFEVHFLFGQKGLIVVSLVSRNSGDDTFYRFARLLRLKYGKPLLVIDLPDIKNRSTEWYDAPLSVKIFSTLSHPDYLGFSIAYSHEKHEAMNSL